MKVTVKPPPLPKPQVSIINLIDVLITLIAFFMFTTVFATKQQQIKVHLPSAAHGETTRVKDMIEILLTAENRIFIGDHQLQPGELADFLRSNYGGKEMVAILADRSCRYEWIVGLLDTVKSCGLTRVSLNVRSQD
ncbi:MAG: biopolymer transporter ExbD [Firmicutes bacterium]|nr:biopolymer transporter ExbD [Bacillota bacterium]